MSAEGLSEAQSRMRDAGVDQVAIDVFSHYYGQLESGKTGIVAESDIEPLTSPARLDDLDLPEAASLQALSESAGAIHVRSDVERKRLFGLAPLESSGSGSDGGIYDPAAGQRTYDRLLEVARLSLSSG